MTPTILWFRRDLRLTDHRALTAALSEGCPVLPVFILDAETESIGAAPLWRLGEAVQEFDRVLRGMGSRLILRRGTAEEVLKGLIQESGARSIHWSRLYDPHSIARDTAVKNWAHAEGIAATSHAGHVLFEPWTVKTGQGGFYRVYSPFWRAVRDLDPGTPLPAPTRLPAPDTWPRSDSLENWKLGRRMNRGADVVRPFAQIGERAALARLDSFLETAVERYKDDRDKPGFKATSRLSENLTYGEISPRLIWCSAHAKLDRFPRGTEHFLKELVWRDFAWHLCFHTPHILDQPWRAEWAAFTWSQDDAREWRHGITGEPMIDAGMRELYVTGTMHNRVRMLVASYLTKHLMRDWRIGQRWFAECLIDWDPASNAMGWQWTAGSGPDAAPYFRIFNPRLQAEKFDADGAYRHRFLSGYRSRDPHPDALAYFDAIPQSWTLSPDTPYPEPMIELSLGRNRALAAYKALKEAESNNT